MDMKIISAFLLSTAICTTPKAMAMESPKSSTPISSPAQSGSASQPIDLTVAADKALNSVVYIKVSASAPKENVQYFNPFEDFFGDFFGQSTPRQQQPRQTPKRSGAGSGVILTADDISSPTTTL